MGMVRRIERSEIDAPASRMARSGIGERKIKIKKKF